MIQGSIGQGEGGALDAKYGGGMGGCKQGGERGQRSALASF